MLRTHIYHLMMLHITFIRH